MFPTARSGHILDLVVQYSEQNFVEDCTAEPDCSISPFHKMITFSLNLKKPGPIYKRINPLLGTTRNNQIFVFLTIVFYCMHKYKTFLWMKFFFLSSPLFCILGFFEVSIFELLPDAGNKKVQEVFKYRHFAHLRVQILK